MADGVRRMSLNALDSEVANAVVVAVVVCKGTVRVFKSRRNPDEARAVFSFTIRDSPQDTANCSAWGSPRFATDLDQMFHIGDVVDIINPQIRPRQLLDRNEMYTPQVSSPFQLVLNERQSDMTIHEAENYIEYLPLLHIPTKSPEGYFTLADILKHSQNIREDYVDLLVAVRSVFSTRMIRTKLGEEIPHRELIVLDQSTITAFRILMWDLESIKRSSSWQPRETILFIADIKLEWSEFHKTVVGRVNSKTIITEDPHTTEAEALRVYARHTPLQKNAVLDKISLDIPDPNSIRSVMTVQQVLDRANADEGSEFTALLYAVVTKIDLDGSNKIIVSKCGGCGGFLKGPVHPCENIECTSSTITEDVPSTPCFDIRVTLTDHTGSLSNCRLTGKFAEKVLDCDVNEFTNMDIDMKGQLKWKYLLERCAVRIVVMKGPLVSVLSCTIADPNEVVSKLPVY